MKKNLLKIIFVIQYYVLMTIEWSSEANKYDEFKSGYYFFKFLQRFKTLKKKGLKYQLQLWNQIQGWEGEKYDKYQAVLSYDLLNVRDCVL